MMRFSAVVLLLLSSTIVFFLLLLSNPLKQTAQATIYTEYSCHTPDYGITVDLTATHSETVGSNFISATGNISKPADFYYDVLANLYRYKCTCPDVQQGTCSQCSSSSVQITNSGGTTVTTTWDSTNPGFPGATGCATLQTDVTLGGVLLRDPANGNTFGITCEPSPGPGVSISEVSSYFCAPTATPTPTPTKTPTPVPTSPPTYPPFNGCHAVSASTDPPNMATYYGGPIWWNTTTFGSANPGDFSEYYIKYSTLPDNNACSAAIIGGGGNCEISPISTMPISFTPTIEPENTYVKSFIRRHILTDVPGKGQYRFICDIDGKWRVEYPVDSQVAYELPFPTVLDELYPPGYGPCQNNCVALWPIPTPSLTPTPTPTTSVGSSQYRVNGRVWIDTNADGIFNDGPPATDLSGWVVRVYDGSTILAQTTTASDGSYGIDAPKLGGTLRFMPQAGKVFTKQDIGPDDCLDSDADVLGYAYEIPPDVSADIYCVFAGIVGTSTTLTPSPTITVTPTIATTPTPITYAPWWQAYSGIAGAGSNIRSLLPSGKTLVASWPPPTFNSAGIPFSNTGSISLGAGGPSQHLYLLSALNHSASFCQDYTVPALLALTRADSITPDSTTVIDDISDIVGSPGYRDYGTHQIYRHTGNLEIVFLNNWNLAGYHLIIFNEGSTEIFDGGNLGQLISLPPDSFLGVFSSGNIVFDTSVGFTTAKSGSSLSPAVTGLFYSNDPLGSGGKVIIESTFDETTEKQFVGSGSYIGCGGFEPRRNLGSTTSEDHPSEAFIYNPNLVKSFPEVLMDAHVHWQEGI